MKLELLQINKYNNIIKSYVRKNEITKIYVTGMNMF